jgi:GNAT superfamily N-acetyltransferase
VRQHPGFIAGTWTLDRETAESFVMLTYASRESAEAMHQSIVGNSQNQQFVDLAQHGPGPSRRDGRVRERGAVEKPVESRRLARTELSRVGEIDRTERIDLIYEQHGTELLERRGNWSAPPWDPDGHGEHSVDAQRHALEHYVDAGGIALDACSGRRLVGIGVVVPHVRPAIAQLAFLHVSKASRGVGIGSRLCDDLELIARGAGDCEMVVSATPSDNTVRFYRGRGYELMAVPLPELFELEPEDVHMKKTL